MCKSTPKRILAVYGTEMGSTKQEAKKIVESWTKEQLKVNMLEGNEASELFDLIPKDYDVLVVMTSSYGDGDAPSGYGKFLYKLYEAAKSGMQPLKGIEQTVCNLEIKGSCKQSVLVQALESLLSSI